MKKSGKKILLIAIIAVFVTCFALLMWYASQYAALAQTQARESVANHPELLHRPPTQPIAAITELPYTISAVSLPISARSALLIDARSGHILFEKNADEIIPPASMIKLVVMYTVFEEIASGRIHLDDVVPLPSEAWARNAPLGSSLMFLSEGERVTVHELLLGLAVVSGNDAATALALYIEGSVEAFCVRMNKTMRSIGLTHTSFVDASGYSEYNRTTAREMALFAKIYLEKHPQALAEYHSIGKLIYPQAHNVPEGMEVRSYTQNATNKLLSVLEGCDGLKTGYIDESGYNLALTVQRDGTRFISVTMGGMGRGSIEGNKYREQDARVLMDWAFASFVTQEYDSVVAPVLVWQGESPLLNAVELKANALTVPSQYVGRVERRLEISSDLIAPIERGEVCGMAIYEADGIILQEIPLIADRSIKQGSFLKRALDTVAKPLSQLF